MELDKWAELTDANGEPYDPRPALAAAASGDSNAAYEELWERVHHQGDLGTAAYAVLPELAGLIRDAPSPDWRAYALLATIEERRHEASNPALPSWIAERYRSALREVLGSALAHLRDAEADETVRSILAVVAHVKGQRTLAAIALWTEDERQEALGEL
ncbi:MAG: hypothetical protein JWO81_1118 [Alphaproteobacteria bacterium]|nr:hypothetical protein [Alphaproteobacteria bacterium]